jgi:hypothetical protein
MRIDFENNVLDSWGDNNGTDNTGVGYSNKSQIRNYAKNSMQQELYRYHTKTYKISLVDL